MKYLFSFGFLAALICCYTLAFGQDFPENDETVPEKFGIDFSANFVVGFPQNEFKTNYDRKILPGLNLDFTFTPARKASYWKTGAQMEVLFGGQEKNDWSGLELRSSTAFMSINSVNRFLPQESMTIKPFVEFGLGLNFSFTSSTYEIYDKASFWEKFLLGEEDQVETITVKDHNDMDLNLSFGIGAIIKDIACVQVKYNYIPEVVYVSPGGISAKQSGYIRIQHLSC